MTDSRSGFILVFPRMKPLLLSDMIESDCCTRDQSDYFSWGQTQLSEVRQGQPTLCNFSLCTDTSFVTKTGWRECRRSSGNCSSRLTFSFMSSWVGPLPRLSMACRHVMPTKESSATRVSIVGSTSFMLGMLWSWTDPELHMPKVGNHHIMCSKLRTWLQLTGMLPSGKSQSRVDYWQQQSREFWRKTSNSKRSVQALFLQFWLVPTRRDTTKFATFLPSSEGRTPVFSSILSQWMKAGFTPGTLPWGCTTKSGLGQENQSIWSPGEPVPQLKSCLFLFRQQGDGLLWICLVPQTVNQQVFRAIFWQFDAVHWRQRPNVTATVHGQRFLHMDNAPAHKVALTLALINQLGWTCLPQPAHSLD